MKKDKKSKNRKAKIQRPKTMVPTMWLLLIILIAVLVLPFFIIKERAILVSAGSILLVSFCYVFYTSLMIFMDREVDNFIVTTLMGLPGEEKPVVEVSKPKKVKNVIDKNLPGAMQDTDTPDPEFDIDETVVEPVKLFDEVDDIELNRCLVDLIQFWDGLSFYKISDSVIYNPETLKTIGELYDIVFSGLATYLQRFHLTYDDLFNEDSSNNEYSQPYSSIVVGYVISLIEKEVAVGLHQHIDKAEIIIPKIKGKNANLIKVVSSSDFKHQVAALIRQYYEKLS